MPHSDPLTAEDLMPLVQKLSHDEQVRLARLALKSAAARGDAEAYQARPQARTNSASTRTLWLGKARVGSRTMHRGDIRWYTLARPDKRRPVLILTRDEVLGALGEVIVVPATRTVRGLATEVLLTSEEGLPAPCALNFDHVSLAQRPRLVH